MRTVAGGLFIVFSGPEGGGKTTQAANLARIFEEEGYQVLLTKEPGGDEGICRDLRKMLVNQDGHYTVPIADGMTEFLLFCGERRQHVLTILLPALAQGKIVICDRYIPDTYAYQCAGRESVAEHEFRYVMSMATREIHIPDLTFWFDVSPSVGLSRKARQQELNRFELEGILFHQRVADGFKYFFSHFGAEYYSVKVDCTQEKATVLSIVKQRALRILRERESRLVLDESPE